MSATLPVRSVGDDAWAAFVETDSQAFGMTVPPEVVEAEHEFFALDRNIAAFDGATVAGIATAYSLQVGVPGGVVPAAGVSWVSVLPTHRRRGVLRSLMHHQLHDVHDQGVEPVAILWASEPPIYGRFGYGCATRACALEVPRDPRALRADAPVDPDLRLRLVRSEDWKLTADTYAEVARNRPGMLTRDERWWLRAVRDHPSLREGRSELRCVVAEDETGVRGYARYSTKADWTPTGPRGNVSVREVMAVDGPAKAALYRYLFDLDLMATVELWNTPVDDPIMHWLDNPRTAAPRLLDALYVRVVDLAAALRARTYTVPVDVVLEVSDEICPWNAGRWRLVSDADGVRCERSELTADLSMAVTEVGAAYLGGTSLDELAMAGRVIEHTPGALRTTSAAFTSSPAPWCPVIF